MSKRQASPKAESDPSFHHVTFRVEKLYPMLLLRSDHQEIVAVTSVKMSKARAEELAKMVNSYLENYRDGGDMFTFTMEGKFT